MDVFSVGHSNLAAAELLALLAQNGRRRARRRATLSGVEAPPAARAAALEHALRGAGIELRVPGRASSAGSSSRTVPIERSENRALREPAFRAYADALDSPAFTAGFARLEALARARPTAVMCAERDWRTVSPPHPVGRARRARLRVVHLAPGRARETHALDPHARARGRAAHVPVPALVARRPRSKKLRDMRALSPRSSCFSPAGPARACSSPCARSRSTTCRRTASTRTRCSRETSRSPGTRRRFRRAGSRPRSGLAPKSIPLWQLGGADRAGRPFHGSALEAVLAELEAGLRANGVANARVELDRRRSPAVYTGKRRAPARARRAASERECVGVRSRLSGGKPCSESPRPCWRWR